MADTYVKETMSTLGPMVKIPGSEYISQAHSKQYMPCGFFETNFYKCMEAYGSYMGRRYCDLEHRDFSECITHSKEMKRVKAIRDERMRQFIQGKLDRPFLRDYPKADAARMDYYSYSPLDE